MPRVIVIGGANVDIKGRAARAYIAGTSNPGEVTISVGGVGRNIAETLARLGAEVDLVTVLGDDANGRQIREACAQAGVNLDHAITGHAASGTYLAILDETGELVSAINDMRNIEWLSPAHLAGLEGAMAAADLIVTDCNVSPACLAWLCAFSARRGVRLLIEPVSVPKAQKLLAISRTGPVYCITPNRQQLEALTGETDQAKALPKLHGMGFENVVVHKGAGGALVSSGGQVVEVPAFPIDAIADVTGAGDAAVAGLVTGLLEGRDLVTAARMGQAAAAIKLASRDSVATALDRDKLLHLAGLK